MSWLRDHMKIFMWITAALFIIPFIGGQVLRQFTSMGQGPNPNVATVNGADVPIEDYRDQFTQLRDQRRENQQGPIKQEDLRELRRQAFRQVINQTLLQQTAQEEGAGATSSEIRQLFLQQISRNQSGQVNTRQARRILKRMPENRRKQLARTHRSQLESYRMSNWLGSLTTVPDTEARLLLREGLREVQLVGLYVNPEEFVEDETVQTYYQQNKADFSRDPRARVRHILLEPDTTARDPLDSIKDTIETVRRRFRAGDSFSVLAEQYSDDKKTAPEGGDLGWVTADDLESSLANEVFTPAGDTDDISNLVRTQEGYHLVYVEEGPERSFRSLSEVRPEIQSRLVSDTHQKQARLQAQQYRQDILEAEDSLGRLRELALAHSHSEFASARRGSYGSVPIRFVLNDRHDNAENWEGELTERNLVLDEISRTLTRLRPDTVSEVVKHKFGYHVFSVTERTEPRLTDLSDTTTRSIRTRLRRTKSDNYTRNWLNQQRANASITVHVSEERIGGIPDWAESG
jgi:parvulin-like peptidyl-prolyl isomerase